MDIKGYQINSKKVSSFWPSVLEEWVLVVERYSRIEEGDASYWWGELSDVGLLAGAVWRAGAIAVTESKIAKLKDSGESSGRADLYIADSIDCEYIEAKHCRFRLDAHSEFGTVFERQMTAAENAASELKEIEGCNTTALTFLMPYVREDLDSEVLAERISRLVVDLLEISPDIAAWCFPSIARGLKDGDGWVCPGIILAAQNVSRS